jgi:hypothetical protein
MSLCLNVLHYFRLTNAISVRRSGVATSPTDVLNGKTTHIFAGSPPGSARTSVAK